MSEPVVDLCFRLSGATVPVDHGYALYAALARVWPQVHEADWLGVHPLTGFSSGKTLKLSRGSRLRLRLPANRVAEVLLLAGRRIELLGSVLQVGVPEIHALRAAAVLQARLVNISIDVITVRRQFLLP